MTDFNTITKQLSDMAEQFKSMAEQYTPKVPEVKFNKNGYEIRSEVLDMAKSWTEFEFSSKFMGWENTVEREEGTGRIINKVNMPPVPGVDNVLDNAQKFYDFINNK